VAELDALFQSLTPAAPDVPVPAIEQKLIAILPIVPLELSEDEQQAVLIHQQARLILGPAGGSVLVCEPTCPFVKRCPLAKMKKQPFNEACPFEQNYVVERFSAWVKELGASLGDLTETERWACSTLTYLDIQELRCLTILSDARNAHLTSRSVRDVDVDTGIAICWEDVIHINAQLLENISVQRMRILKSFELTPEQQTKKQKAESRRFSNDLSSRQADNADKLRRHQQKKKKPQTIDLD
jgi:hypothetical protein